MGQAARRLSKRFGRHPQLLEELQQWCVHMLATRGLKPTSCRNYLEAACSLAEWMIDHGVERDELDTDQVDAWLKDLYIRNRLSGETRALHLVGARAWYQWRQWQGLSGNPLAEISGPRKPHRLPRKFRPDQVRALLGACDRQTLAGKRDYAVMIFALSTGARVGEIRRLRISQLELRQRVGRVSIDGKGAKERSVSFEGPVIEALLDWMHARQDLRLLDPDLVWCSLRRLSPGASLSIRGVDWILQRAARRAGLKPHEVSWRRWRVTYATELYDSGAADIEEIRQLLGHASIETTRRYISVSERMRVSRMSARHLRRLVGDERSLPLWLQGKGVSDEAH